ncbi:MAG: helicase C-terminal domain-containing protein [Planctomycetota bacterium]
MAFAVVAPGEGASDGPGSWRLRIGACLGGTRGRAGGELFETTLEAVNPMEGLLALEGFVRGRPVLVFDLEWLEPLLSAPGAERSLLPSLAGAAEIRLFSHLVHPEWFDHSASALRRRFDLAPEGRPDQTGSAPTARALLGLVEALRSDLSAERDPEGVLALKYDLGRAESPLAGLLEDLPLATPRQAVPEDPLLGEERGDERPFRQPVLDQELLDLFSPDGPIARAVPGYARREAQLSLARSVASALNEGRSLMAEVGTGVGKSLGYLVPVLLYAVRNGLPALVATKTKNLQAQLFGRELPLLKEALGLSFRAALVKGRGDYLCLRRLESLSRSVQERGDSREFLALAFFRRFAERSGDGDLEQISAWIVSRLPPARRFLERLRCEHAPTARSCSHGGRCFFARVWRRARGAHLLIANHALLLNWPRAHKRPEIVIVDEAHDLVDTATDAFGRELSLAGIRGVLSRLDRDDSATSVRAVMRRADALEMEEGVFRETVSERLEGILEESAELLLQSLPGLTLAVERLLRACPAPAPADGEDRQVLALGRQVREDPEFDTLRNLFARFGSRCRELAAGVAKLAAGLPPQGELRGELSGIADRVDEIVAVLDEILDGADGLVTWVEWRPAGSKRPAHWSLRAAFVDVGKELHLRLLEPCFSAVLTSATLRVADNFEFFGTQTGFFRLDPERRIEPLAFGSPFDYQRSLRFYVPLGGGNVLARDPRIAARAVARSVFVVACALNGRTLVLFNSKARMLRVADLLKARLAARSVRLLCPGPDGSAARVLESFRQEGRCVLLGARAFFEGVDVRGSGLLCTILERIPFEPPTDPIHLARAEQLRSEGRDGFLEYSLPRAMVRLLQGSGRVVRSEQDRGAVLLLDPRVATSPRYSARVLRSLPAECEIGPEAVIYQAFFRRMAEFLVPGVENPESLLASFTDDLLGRSES